MSLWLGESVNRGEVCAPNTVQFCVMCLRLPNKHRCGNNRDFWDFCGLPVERREGGRTRLLSVTAPAEVCVCVCVCVRARERVCVCLCVCACMWACV